MIKRVTFALTVLALVAGCSSGVKLDDVPVEDKTATSTMGGANSGANSGSTGQSGVAGVDLNQSGRDAAGPVGVSRIVYFDYDSYVIKPEFQSLIEAHSRFIKTGQGRKVMIEGHTDDVGSDASNMLLSQRRADTVKAFLVAQGITASRLDASGKGEAAPLASNISADGRQQNRRVEVIIANTTE